MSLRLMEHIVALGSPPIVPIRVDQYQQMMEQGILPEGAPIELIDGSAMCSSRDPSSATTIARRSRTSAC
jgi:hypothetical protein